VHLEFGTTLLHVDVSQLVAIKHKLWLGHLTPACLYVGGFFVVNNGLPVDLVNTQMLWCIICRFEQTFNDVLVQKSTMFKGLIKYNKINWMTPMTIHVQTTQMKIFALKNQLSNEVVEHVVIHAQG
jgi:hypothetical protein